MNVYHITYAPEIKTASLYFDGCNFNCLGCIRKKTMYDAHLKARSGSKSGFLSLNEVLKILNRIGARTVIMMGGEPTIDPELPTLVEKLRKSGISSVLLTNGYELEDKLLESVDRICVSIKAWSDELHRKFTGKSNKNTLKNFRKIYDSGVSLYSESIYIPSLVEVREIGKIARFISSVDPEIPYRIDAYIPVNGLWRAPTSKEVKEAVKEAKKHLRRVTCLYGDEKLKYEVLNVI